MQIHTITLPISVKLANLYCYLLMIAPVTFALPVLKDYFKTKVLALAAYTTNVTLDCQQFPLCNSG